MLAAVLMDSHTPEIVEAIPFQIEETTPATVVNTVETMDHTVLTYQVTAVTIPLHAADAAAEIASHTPCRNATIPVKTSVAIPAIHCHVAAICSNTGLITLSYADVNAWQIASHAGLIAYSYAQVKTAAHASM